jgi:hypothetical protein
VCTSNFSVYGHVAYRDKKFVVSLCVFHLRRFIQLILRNPRLSSRIQDLGWGRQARIKAEVYHKKRLSLGVKNSGAVPGENDFVTSERSHLDRRQSQKRGFQNCTRLVLRTYWRWHQSHLLQRKRPSLTPFFQNQGTTSKSTACASLHAL